MSTIVSSRQAFLESLYGRPLTNQEKQVLKMLERKVKELNNDHNKITLRIGRLK